MTRVGVESSSVDAAIAAAGNKATWAGSAVTVVGGVTSSDIGMYAGIFIGLAGLAVTWYFKHKAELRYAQANKRYEEAHVAYMERLRCSEWNQYLVPPPTVKEEKEI